MYVIFVVSAVTVLFDSAGALTIHSRKYTLSSTKLNYHTSSRIKRTDSELARQTMAFLPRGNQTTSPHNSVSVFDKFMTLF